MDSFLQAYHWTLPQAMSLTMPQIIMLNHAAWVNRENAERKYKAKKDNKRGSLDEDTGYAAERQEYESLSPSEQSNYLAGIGSF